MIEEASSLTAKNSACVGFVCERESLILFCDAFDLWDRGGVTVHAEEGVGEDPCHAVAMSVVLKEFLESLGVYVGIDECFGTGEFASIDDTSVI